jgi:hypothetical protein
MMLENPLSPTVKGVLALAALGGVAAAVYYATRPAIAAATSTSSAPATLALAVGQTTASAVIPAGGLTVTIPQGSTWDSSMPAPYNGTGSPMQFPYVSAGQTQTENLVWTPAGGTSQTTVLTLST